jgi:hypothetical protein
MATQAIITDWSQDHTTCLAKDELGNYYVFTSASGTELDFSACAALVLAGTATAATPNSV